MKTISLLLSSFLLVAISCCNGAALNRSKRQIVPKEFANVNIENYLKNDRAVQFQLKCIVYDGPCDRIGKYLKVTIPELLTNQCQNCDPAQRQRAGRLVQHIQQKFPKEWSDAVQKFQGGQVKKDDADRLESLLGVKLDAKHVAKISTTVAPVTSSTTSAPVTTIAPVVSSTEASSTTTLEPMTSSAAPVTTTTLAPSTTNSSTSAPETSSSIVPEVTSSTTTTTTTAIPSTTPTNSSEVSSSVAPLISSSLAPEISSSVAPEILPIEVSTSAAPIISEVPSTSSTTSSTTSAPAIVQSSPASI